MNRRNFLKSLAVGIGFVILPGPLMSSVSGESGFVPIDFYYSSVRLNENWIKRLELGSFESFRFIPSDVENN